jgi:hypothetical protein
MLLPAPSRPEPNRCRAGRLLARLRGLGEAAGPGGAAGAGLRGSGHVARLGCGRVGQMGRWAGWGCGRSGCGLEDCRNQVLHSGNSKPFSQTKLQSRLDAIALAE